MDYKIVLYRGSSVFEISLLFMKNQCYIEVPVYLKSFGLVIVYEKSVLYRGSSVFEIVWSRYCLWKISVISRFQCIWNRSVSLLFMKNQCHIEVPVYLKSFGLVIVYEKSVSYRGSSVFEIVRSRYCLWKISVISRFQCIWNRSVSLLLWKISVISRFQCIWNRLVSLLFMKNQCHIEVPVYLKSFGLVIVYEKSVLYRGSSVFEIVWSRYCLWKISVISRFQCIWNRLVSLLFMKNQCHIEVPVYLKSFGLVITYEIQLLVSDHITIIYDRSGKWITSRSYNCAWPNEMGRVFAHKLVACAWTHLYYSLCSRNHLCCSSHRWNIRTINWFSTLLFWLLTCSIAVKRSIHLQIV